MKILITGAAGFIGAALMHRLVLSGEEVAGIDNINGYYDVALKHGRLSELGFSLPYTDGDISISDLYPNARFMKMDICDRQLLNGLFDRYEFDTVINMAAQAGVRYSISNPYAYLHSNLDGFLNILECCRNHGVSHLVFASSSSVYGLNSKIPYSEADKTDSPVSLYAATKKSNELMAHAYSKLYGFRSTGLRFFTVYGPWGRPDMAPMLFATAIYSGKPIWVFNHGDMMRDFTYIDDIVEGVMKVVTAGQQLGSPAPDEVPFKVYNIGCSHPVKLMDFISEIETALGRQAEKIYLPMQAGDVRATYADTSMLEKDFGYKPSTPLHEGISCFMDWFLSEKNPLKE